MFAMRRLQLERSAPRRAPRSSSSGKRERRRQAARPYPARWSSRQRRRAPPAVPFSTRAADKRAFDVVVGVVGGLGLLARGVDLRMQPDRRILRLLGPAASRSRVQRRALAGELVEQPPAAARCVRCATILRASWLRSVVLGGVHRGPRRAARAARCAPCRCPRSRSVAAESFASDKLSRSCAAALRSGTTCSLSSSVRTARRSAACSKLGKLRLQASSTVGRASATVLSRLLALALHVGELAAARAERVGGALGLRLAPACVLPRCSANFCDSCRLSAWACAQRFLGRALCFLCLRVRDLRAHQLLTRLVKLARAGKHALVAGACCAHRQLAGRPHDAAIGRHEAYRAPCMPACAAMRLRQGSRTPPRRRAAPRRRAHRPAHR